MKEIAIKQASLEDIQTLQFLGRETFSETFAKSNTQENMKRYLDVNFSEEKLRNELNHPDSLFFIAWQGDKAIGYLKLNSGKAQTEAQDESALEIERIYVLSQYHGKKVGQLLYEKALETAEKQEKSFIWLGVWEKNPRAVRFYEKNGFVAFGKHVFKMGDDEQIDMMMRKFL